MEIKATKNGDALEVALSGRLDTNTSPDLEGYLRENLEGIASLDFQRALTISTAAACGVWLLFVALAVYMVKKSSGKPRPKRV